MTYMLSKSRHSSLTLSKQSRWDLLRGSFRQVSLSWDTWRPCRVWSFPRPLPASHRLAAAFQVILEIPPLFYDRHNCKTITSLWPFQLRKCDFWIGITEEKTAAPSGHQYGMLLTLSGLSATRLIHFVTLWDFPCSGAVKHLHHILFFNPNEEKNVCADVSRELALNSRVV